MAKRADAQKKVFQISKKEKYLRHAKMDSKIKEKLLQELQLKKKKEHLKMNSVNFERHFNKNLKKVQRRKRRLDIPKQVVSLSILLNFKF